MRGGPLLGAIFAATGIICPLRKAPGKAWALIPILLGGGFYPPERFLIPDRITAQPDEAEGHRVAGLDQYVYGTGETTVRAVTFWLKGQFRRFTGRRLVIIGSSWTATTYHMGTERAR